MTQSTHSQLSKETIELKKLPIERLWITGFIMISVAALMISLVFTLILPKIPGNIKYLPAGIVFLIVLGSFFNFFRAVREQIILNKTTLSYKRGSKTTTIALTDIREVEIIENIASGFSVRNIITRLISDILMGKYQLQVVLKKGTSVFIPRVAGGGNLISPNLGFTKEYSENAKKQIEDYMNLNPSVKVTQSVKEDVEIIEIPKDKYCIKDLEEESIEFKDFGFKLSIIQELMYNQGLIQPKFDLYEFVEWYSEREIDIEEEGYEPIAEVTQYFKDLQVPKKWASEITEIYQDGGNEVYLSLLRFGEGDEDFWDIESSEDAKNFPNLKKVTLCYAKDTILEELNAMGIETKWI